MVLLVSAERIPAGVMPPPAWSSHGSSHSKGFHKGQSLQTGVESGWTGSCLSSCTQNNLIFVFFALNTLEERKELLESINNKNLLCVHRRKKVAPSLGSCRLKLALSCMFRFAYLNPLERDRSGNADKVTLQLTWKPLHCT